MATAFAGSYTRRPVAAARPSRKCACSPLSSLEHSSKRLGMSPKMDAYDAGVFVAGWGTDTFDSWSQIHKCLPLPYRCLKAT